MHKTLIYLAFGSLTVAGAMHFLIDVVGQHVRGKRPPGPETTLYYGLNAGYALGQVAFGLLALNVASQAIEVFGYWSLIAVALAAGVAWLVFGFAFLDYWEPRIATVVYCGLVVAAAMTA